MTKYKIIKLPFQIILAIFVIGITLPILIPTALITEDNWKDFRNGLVEFYEGLWR
jgi:hypothetical protein